jgi:hypothetical protein
LFGPWLRQPHGRPRRPYRNLTVDEQGIGIAFERAGDDADPMNKPPAKTNVERTPAGLQMILPGCERRTLPKSTSRVDEGGQGLLGFFKPPTLRERLATRNEAPLRSSRGQKAMPRSGLFGCSEQSTGTAGPAGAMGFESLENDAFS